MFDLRLLGSSKQHQKSCVFLSLVIVCILLAPKLLLYLMSLNEMQIHFWTTGVSFDRVGSYNTILLLLAAPLRCVGVFGAMGLNSGGKINGQFLFCCFSNAFLRRLNRGNYIRKSPNKQYLNGRQIWSHSFWDLDPNSKYAFLFALLPLFRFLINYKRSLIRNH